MAQLFLRLARIGLANLWRNPRRTGITVAALAIGMIMLACTVSLMAGITRDLIEQGTGLLLGHVQVHAAGYRPDRSIFDTIPGDGLALLDRLQETSNVTAAAPRAIGYGLVSAGDHSAGVELLGIDPARETTVGDLQNRVVAGRDLRADGEREILIGTRLARTLGASPGDDLVVLTQAADGSMGNNMYGVVGLFDTGVDGIDEGLLVMRLADLQELLALSQERIHEIALRTHSAADAPALASRLAAEVGGEGVEVAAWPQLAPQIAAYVGMSEGWLGIMYLIVIGLAAIAVLNTMLMAVFERYREFGVMTAIGMRPQHILLLVATEVAALAFLSVTVAIVVGAPLLIWLIYSGIDLRNFTDGFTMVGVAFSPILRGVWTPAEFVQATLLLIACALLSGLYPAARAARVDPATLTRGGVR